MPFLPRERVRVKRGLACVPKFCEVVALVGVGICPVVVWTGKTWAGEVKEEKKLLLPLPLDVVGAGVGAGVGVGAGATVQLWVRVGWETVVPQELASVQVRAWRLSVQVDQVVQDQASVQGVGWMGAV